MSDDESKIFILYNERYFASCPKCASQDWLIEVNGRGAAWTRVMGTECSSCGYYIEWKVIAVSSNGISDKKKYE